MGTRPQGDDSAPVEIARNSPKGVFRVCLLLYALGVRTKSDARKEQVMSWLIMSVKVALGKLLSIRLYFSVGATHEETYANQQWSTWQALGAAAGAFCFTFASLLMGSIAI